MLKLKNLFLPLLLIFITTLIGCDKNTTSNSDVLSRTELFMGTAVTITLYDSNDSSILDKAFDRVAEIESLVSINDSGTELDINISGLQLAISAGFVLFSSAVILFQTSSIINGGERNYIMATISLYVSIYNMFISLLSILGFASRD